MKTVDEFLMLVRDEAGQEVTVPTVRNGSDKPPARDALTSPPPTAPERATGVRVPRALRPETARPEDLPGPTVESVRT
ncbi:MULTISPECIES: hypothetical protein [unclassified Streptomyces]|uniref:hypothetical protein n=1 Tax=unclassified Streptomyces TaxID=2593676 RepID=UPI00190BB7DE|nr:MULTISPECIES: hypothetical protein [unclassified Streptomyces]MBK3565998.1 hypothetical protein [Streptomyces sp. MBT62]MBK6014251.1 hypothetical protein [Streptomyces sp. MBT53]